MRTLPHVRALFLLAGSELASACASSVPPPQDLVTARSVYEQASVGPAAQYDPADLHSAKEQLDMAEAAFSKDGDTDYTRDQAYLAVRKTQLAEVNARTLQSNRDKEQALAAIQQNQARTVARMSNELGRSEAQLAAASVALGDESARRQEAEKRTAEALAAVAKFANVKQEPRGTVITLSGSVLFESAKSDLLSSAEARLDEVAAALIKEDPLSRIVVEGHTDSQGGASYNMDLSQRRADAVRSYLVAHGVAADRITAKGFGLDRPIADNGSPEGRANNRRVEVVVQPKAATP